MRKLLPYEHALIKELGITEEEYFTFRKAQREYADPKSGTILDIRNEPVSTIALVLSIIGTIAQVASALLAPRPQTPEVSGNQRVRDKRFAPRYGFDSVQELAQYGDPVNLVYTNQGTSGNENPNGGVRVGTSLLWSAVYSVGNAQYLQMMAAIGAGNIQAIDYEKTAFGSTLIKLFARNSAWIYSRNSGSLLFSDKKIGNDRDPAQLLTSTSRTVYDPVLDFNARSEGFSQAYSPSSATEFGIASPVPINVKVYARDAKGAQRSADVRIDVTSGRGAWWPDLYNTGPRPLILKDQIITVRVSTVKTRRNDTDEADDFSDEVRSGVAESFELGALYKLGSAKFQLIGIDGDSQLDRGSLTLSLQCTESGCGPFESYSVENTQEREDELNSQKTQLEQDIANLTDQINSISTANYVNSNLPAQRIRLLESTRVKRDQVETLYEAVVSYKRNVAEMDELVLAAENKIPGRQFSSQVIQLANAISEKETALEQARDQKERINANIERLGDTNERRENLRNTKNTIATIKEDLKNFRSRLSDHLREYAVKDGVITSMLATARQLRADLKNEFREELSSTDYDNIWNQAIDDLVDLNHSDGKASTEREILRRLKNLFAKVENLLITATNYVNYDAFNAAKNSLINSRTAKQNELNGIINQLKDPESFNDHLGTKCLVRLHEANYETLSPVNLVHFSLKAKVFMSIQGRATKYGETDEPRYKDSDNGYKSRTAMFRVKFKRPFETEDQWKSPNIIFCVRKTYDKDAFIPLFFRSGVQEKWQFRIEPIYDAPSEAKKAGNSLNFVYLEGRGAVIPVGETIEQCNFYCRGQIRTADADNRPPRNHSPKGVDEWTVFSTHADTSIHYSFDNGPEFRLVSVTEQQFDPRSNYPKLYEGIATIGVNAYSAAGLTNVSNLSVLVTKGKLVRNIELSPPSCPALPNAPSCWAPDIFLDTVLDKVNGIGEYVDFSTINNAHIDIASVDIESLALAKAFCMRNQYYMDGIIADKTAWRAFWNEVAPYSLLELAKIGGKETLLPAVPTTNDGTITRNINISALFNQGNILEDSYKEDFIDYGESTQDVIVTIVYRSQSSTESFPRNTSVTVKLKDATEELASRRSFDLSNFVTNRNQAINYAMLLCSQRRYIRRAVEFKTFPTEAPIRPGEYIYVHMEDNQWNNVYSGMVLADGTLNIPFASEAITGTFSTLIYRQGQEPVKQDIAYTNGQSSVLSQFRNALFVLGTQVSGKRVFRVIEVAMEGEGEVTIRAVEHPCIEENGNTKSLIVQFNPALYDIS